MPELNIDDLIIATRILVNEHVIDGFGHVSVRDPNRLDRYFMTRDNFGGTKREDYIVELDLDPCVWDIFAAAINEARTGKKERWWKWTKVRKQRQLDRTFCI